MNNPDKPDPLNGPSGSDASGSSQAQLGRVIAELKQTLERVPEQTEFTNSPRYKLWGPVIALAGVGGVFFGLSSGKLLVVLCGVALVLFGAALFWQHRNAGTQVFMRLTRRQVWVDTLSAPVDLADVEDISVKEEGLLTTQELTLSREAILPTHRVRHMVFFADQAVVDTEPEPCIRIMSAGLMSGGRKVSAREMAALLEAYRDAACAERQLAVVQPRG